MNIPTQGNVVAQFGAKWCSPCKTIEPFVREQAQNHGAEFLHIDVEEHPMLADQYRIRSMPTIITFINGTEIRRVNSASRDLIRDGVQGTFQRGLHA